MLDIGAWGEFIIIMILALVIVGPKDLPKVVRTLGSWLGKLQRVTYSARHVLTTLMQPQDMPPHQEDTPSPKSTPPTSADIHKETVKEDRT